MCKRPDKLVVLEEEMQINREFQEEMSRMLQLLVKAILQRLNDEANEFWAGTGSRPKPGEWDSSEFDLDVMLTDSELKVLQQAVDRPYTIMSWITDYACSSKEWNVPPPLKSMFHAYQVLIILGIQQLCP